MPRERGRRRLLLAGLATALPEFGANEVLVARGGESGRVVRYLKDTGMRVGLFYMMSRYRT